MVEEHRGLYAGLAIALVGTGVGGLVAYVIALQLSTAERSFHWTNPVSLLCFGVIAMGVAGIVVVRASYDKAQRRKLMLDKKLQEGHTILEAARLADIPGFAPFKTSVPQWTAEVRSYLDSTFPSYVGFFMSDAGLRVVAYGPEDTRTYAEEMERRLTRLNGIIMKLD